MWERKFLGSPRPGVSTCGLKGGKLPPPLARTSQGPASQQHRRNQSRQGEALDFVTITSCSCKICRWLEGNEVRTVRACFLLSNRRGLPRIPHPRPTLRTATPTHGLTASRPPAHGSADPETSPDLSSGQLAQHSSPHRSTRHSHRQVTRCIFICIAISHLKQDAPGNSSFPFKHQPPHEPPAHGRLPRQCSWSISCVCVCTCACCGVVVTITGDDNYKGKEAQEDHTFLIPGWGSGKTSWGR